MGEDIISVRLTKRELWELINIFGAGFEDGAPGNEVATRVSNILSDAYNKSKKLEATTSQASAIAEAVKAEREACARLLDDHWLKSKSQAETVLVKGLAAAIRARNTP